MPRKPPPSSLPHVKRVTTKGRVYLYFDTGQAKPNGAMIYAKLPPVTDPLFAGRYAALCAHRTRRANLVSAMTVPQLAERFRKSSAFPPAPASRKLYTMTLDRFESLLPTAPAGELTTADMRDLLEGIADTPGAANALLRVTGALYRYGRRHGHVGNEPTRGIEAFEMGEHQPWARDTLERGLASNVARVRLAIHLLYFTTQRIGDVASVRWSDLRGGVWDMTQGKTGKSLVVPLHRDLRTELARHAPTGPFVFSGPRGKPVQPVTLRKAIQGEVGDDVVPHGLRKNGVIALLECGCSVAETAAISGQSLKLVEHYAKARDQRSLAESSILKWEAKKA